MINRRQYFLSAFIFVVILGGFFPNVNAQEFSLNLKLDYEYCWVIEEFNETLFHDMFGATDIQENDSLTIAVRAVNNYDNNFWGLSIEIWGFGISRHGTSLNIPKNPADFEYDHNYIIGNQRTIFIPIPVNTYLQEVLIYSPDAFDLVGLTIHVQDDLNEPITIKKEYNSNGITIGETYYDRNNNVILKINEDFPETPATISGYSFNLILSMLLFITLLISGKITLGYKKED